MIRPSSRASRLGSFRPLSSSFARSNARQSLLDVLREAGPPLPPKKEILILKPSETQDKTISRFFANLSKPRQRSRKRSLPKVLGDETRALGELSLEESFEAFRSSKEHTVPQKVIQDLTRAFSKPQLLRYAQRAGQVPSKWAVNKLKLSTFIVEQIWHRRLSTMDTVLQKEQVPLTHAEMFMLLSQKGSLLRFMRLMLTLLDFDPAKSELVFVGTESQIQNAKINLANRFESAAREDLDLSILQTLYEEKFGAFSIADIGKMIEVYFHHLHGRTYELVALTHDQVRRIKRLLVWFLDPNMHKRQFVHVPDNVDLAACLLVPHLDDYSMLWMARFKTHYRLVDEKVTPSRSDSFKREMEQFSDDKLRAVDYNVDNFASPELLQEAIDLEKDTIELLESLGIFAEGEPLSYVAEKGLREWFSELEKEKMYAQLTDFNYRRSLAGIDVLRADNPIFTVTLGKVLFADKKSALLAPKPAEIGNNVTFTTHTPLAYDSVLAEAVSKTELLNPLDDPHAYSLQFKFLPSPYVDSLATARNSAKYPPIEMWMQLTDRSLPDLETLQLVTVEVENSGLVCLPQSACDMKITCQVTGRLLDEADGAEAAEAPDIFSATSSKYGRLRGQPGVEQFLRELKLDFRGWQLTQIAPHADFVVNGETVCYAYVSMNYRRELLLEVGRGRKVQVNVVDGGALGGRRVEVRFIGDFTDYTRASFDDLVDYTRLFIGGM